jgi:hypothetical protein
LRLVRCALRHAYRMDDTNKRQKHGPTLNDVGTPEAEAET